MKIGTKSIPGISVYNSSVTYEKNDFAVLSGIIYVCKKECQDKTPSENREYWGLYPLDAIRSKEEYYSWKNNYSADEPDKLITASAFEEVLSSIYFGLGDNGVIEDHCEYKNGDIIYSVGGVTEVIPETQKDYSILGKILNTPDLNNGIMWISYEIPEIQRICGDLTSNVLLRQFTYKSSRYFKRVQELIVPEKSQIYWRHTEDISDLNSAPFVIWQSWTPVLKYSSVTEEMSRIKELYDAKMEELERTKESLVGNFCFYKIGLESGDIIPDSIGSVITMTICVENENNIHRHYSITLMPSENATYYVDDTHSVSIDNERHVTLSGSDMKIIDIYYRKEYVRN